MKKIFLGIFAVSLAFISCKKDEKPTYLKDDTSTTSTNNFVSNTPNISILDQAGINNSSVQPTTNSSTVIKNPPHGQPGHRCDIPEGQPLNVTPQQIGNVQTVQVPQNQSVVINPAQMKMSTPPQKVQTAPGMNPPHGEPGHRCDIAVGAPLNSNPSTTQNTAVAQNTPVANTPSNNAPNLVEIGEKPKVNPPHGEPFHDCAKSVGEPL